VDGSESPHGLWNAGGTSVDRLQRLAVYVATPVVIAVLFGEIDSIGRFGRGYARGLLVTLSICGMFELAYQWIWPALVRRRVRFALRLVFHAVTVVVVVAPGVMLAQLVARTALGWRLNAERLWLQGVVISGVIVAILAVTDELRERSRELVRRDAAHRVAVLRAELSALQARTDPHFLFNSLNTVAALIPDDPLLAETLLEKLASVFRYALDAGRRERVALADEIEAVTAYLEVEALRLGARLRWTLARDAGVERVRVPPLVLQPLVENAIRHGAGSRQGATEVAIELRRSGDQVALVVEDRALDDAPTSPPPRGAGTALVDLRARLELAFGERARLNAGPTPAGWRAEIVVPAAAGPDPDKP
jgi:two-component system sensor histidine kinase AlgZ